MSEVTNTGIPVEECVQCGGRHPLTRRHCSVCGRASLFGHKECRDGFKPWDGNVYRFYQGALPGLERALVRGSGGKD